MPPLRIVSLLPSATEIICAVGARSGLVGVSHECDYPDDVCGLPVLTRPKFPPVRGSLQIDREVRQVIRQALAVYDIDTDLLRSLAPDVIITQDLCDVCAVSYDDVCAAVREMVDRDVAIVNLHPTHLSDIWADIRKVALALGRAGEGEVLLESLHERVSNVQTRAAKASARLDVVAIEWIEPVMLGGTWMPELIDTAGGRALGVAAGQHAPTLDHAALAALSPEVVVIKPCGYPIARTVEELSRLPRVLPWQTWPAVAADRVFVADGSAYFNRPGPRIADSIEILAACLHPALFPETRARYPDAVLEVSRDLGTHRWAGQRSRSR